MGLVCRQYLSESRVEASRYIFGDPNIVQYPDEIGIPTGQGLDPLEGSLAVRERLE
jgi:hypothetical protein